MHTDLITDGDGQRTQVGPNPLDYVLRYAAGDYDCYHRGRYIGSRATRASAIAAVRYEQEKAARHPLPTPAVDYSIVAYQGELRAIAARLQDLYERLASRPVESTPTIAHLAIARINISHALRSAHDAERSFTLAQRAADLITPLDTAA